jgi:hypothetical protein
VFLAGLRGFLYDFYVFDTYSNRVTQHVVFPTTGLCANTDD